MDTLDDAMFVPDGDGFVVATKLTQGPWDPGSQYGGCPAALLTWAAEQVPTLVPMRIARITADMHRSVPLGRLGVGAEVVREGKRLQLVLTTIRDTAGVEVARATVLRMRLGPAPDAPTDPRFPAIATPPFGPVRPPRQRTSDLSGFMDAAEVRESEHPLTTTNWFRAPARSSPARRRRPRCGSRGPPISLRTAATTSTSRSGRRSTAT